METETRRTGSIRLLRQYHDQYGGRRPAEHVALIGALYAHRDHGPADSMHGRCTACGMTWDEQSHGQQLLQRNPLFA